MTKLKVGIFGAASENISKKKKDLAYEVGQLIGMYNHVLIYGAGSTGCMGHCAKGYIDTKPQLRPFGSTTSFIESIERPMDGINLIPCETLAQREELYYLADILVVLPGGSGTLREFWGFLTEKRLEQWTGELWVLDEGWICDSLKKQLKELEIQGCARHIEEYVRFISLKDFALEMFVRSTEPGKPKWIGG